MVTNGLSELSSPGLHQELLLSCWASELSADRPAVLACETRWYPARNARRNAWPSGDLHLAYLARRRARDEVARKLGERLDFVGSFHLPPDGVATGVARRDGDLMAERTDKSFPRGERGRALVRLMAVIEDVLGHGPIVTARPDLLIGVAP